MRYKAREEQIIENRIREQELMIVHKLQNITEQTQSIDFNKKNFQD
jgi:hypothetical protein